MRGEREFEPGDRVRVSAPGRATHGRPGTVVAPDDAWPFGPCVVLDGDVEPGAYEACEVEPLVASEPPFRSAPIAAEGADERLARAIAALILEERTRTETVWRAKLAAARAEAGDLAGLDREALVAVLACAEDYVSGAPLNRALVLHALRSALVRLGARPGEQPHAARPSGSTGR